jgi:HSP20 family molecular chaperone IbpA
MNTILKHPLDYVDTDLRNTTNLIDYMSNLFFNYKDQSTQFATMPVKTLANLPFNGVNSEIVHYGGDYLITASEDEDKDYIIHFALPGHNKDTCDVIKSDKYIIVKSKKEDDSTYNFYKRIPLVKTSYEVGSVIFKDGILSITIKDPKEDNKEEELEIIQQ